MPHLERLRCRSGVQYQADFSAHCLSKKFEFDYDGFLVQADEALQIVPPLFSKSDTPQEYNFKQTSYYTIAPGSGMLPAHTVAVKRRKRSIAWVLMRAVGIPYDCTGVWHAEIHMHAVDFCRKSDDTSLHILANVILPDCIGGPACGDTRIRCLKTKSPEPQ